MWDYKDEPEGVDDYEDDKKEFEEEDYEDEEDWQSLP